jgi:hypothetical protein
MAWTTTRIDIVGEVSIDEGEEGPVMDTAQVSGAGGDARRRRLDKMSGLATWVVKESRLVRSRHR